MGNLLLLFCLLNFLFHERCIKHHHRMQAICSSRDLLSLPFTHSPIHPFYAPWSSKPLNYLAKRPVRHPRSILVSLPKSVCKVLRILPIVAAGPCRWLKILPDATLVFSALQCCEQSVPPLAKAPRKHRIRSFFSRLRLLLFNSALQSTLKPLRRLDYILNSLSFR
jgi:hypothetical protein